MEDTSHLSYTESGEGGADSMENTSQGAAGPSQPQSEEVVNVQVEQEPGVGDTTGWQIYKWNTAKYNGLQYDMGHIIKLDDQKVLILQRNGDFLEYVRNVEYELAYFRKHIDKIVPAKKKRTTVRKRINEM